MPTNVYTGLPEETAAQRAAFVREIKPWAVAGAVAAFVTLATAIITSLA